MRPSSPSQKNKVGLTPKRLLRAAMWFLVRLRPRPLRTLETSDLLPISGRSATPRPCCSIRSLSTSTPPRPAMRALNSANSPDRASQRSMASIRPSVVFAELVVSDPSSSHSYLAAYSINSWCLPSGSSMSSLIFPPAASI